MFFLEDKRIILEEFKKYKIRHNIQLNALASGNHQKGIQRPYRTPYSPALLEKLDIRDPFNHDRDRIIHARSFRRLSQKTQLFDNLQQDHVRTRMTHTLAVAQIAETIAHFFEAHGNLTVSIALAHDIGHPPFGHFGENVLTELIKDEGGYHHNDYSFRQVMLLDSPYPYCHGLNLTYATLDGILKHGYDGKSKKHHTYTASLFYKKKGYFTALDHDLEPESPPSLEAQIAGIADDLAYLSHDTEDSLLLDMLSLQDLYECVPELYSIERLIRREYPEIQEKQLIRFFPYVMLKLFVSDTIAETSQRLMQYNIKSPKDMRECSGSVVDFSQETSVVLGKIKKIFQEKIYKRMAQNFEQQGYKNTLERLFEYYLEHTDLLPTVPSFIRDHDSLKRQIIDYLSGMTNRFALSEYRRLFVLHHS